MDIRAWLITFAQILVLAAIVFAFIRCVKGPTVVDRALALDLIASLVVFLIGLYAVQTDDAYFIDVLLALALLNFLVFVALARFMRPSRRRQRESQG